MNINIYKLKENTSINDLLKNGFDYSINRRYLVKVVKLKDTIILWVEVSLNDFTAKIAVLDDDYCQYYTPFYNYMDKKIKGFEFLNKVIDSYNCEMEKITCFEKSN